MKIAKILELLPFRSLIDINTSDKMRAIVQKMGLENMKCKDIILKNEQKYNVMYVLTCETEGIHVIERHVFDVNGRQKFVIKYKNGQFLFFAVSNTQAQANELCYFEYSHENNKNMFGVGADKMVAYPQIFVNNNARNDIKKRFFHQWNESWQTIKKFVYSTMPMEQCAKYSAHLARLAQKKREQNRLAREQQVANT